MIDPLEMTQVRKNNDIYEEKYIMKNSIYTEKTVGLFLVVILSFIFTFRFEYSALAALPAIVSLFPILWKKNGELTPSGYKRMNQTSLIMYAISFAISLVMLVLVLIYRGKVEITLLCAALISVANEAMLLMVFVPFVYCHCTVNKVICWVLYALLAVVIGCFSTICLTDSIIQGICAVVICPLAVIGAIIQYRHFVKRC